ncbi:MAG TPA: PsbP-related protein [Thermomicrobiales bacterium]|nr:PsbP-related protein [Thermomicrobiales bacterium]
MNVRRWRALALPALLVTLLALLAGCSLGSSAPPTATPTSAASAQLASTPTPTAATPASPTAAGSATPATGAAAASASASQVTVTAPRPTATRMPASPTPWGSPLPTLGAGQQYQDPQARFSFTIPGNWSQVQASGAEVAFQSPAPPGGVPATVNVVLEKLPSASVSLDDYNQAGEASLKQQFQDYKQISLTKVVVDGHPAYKRLYTATIAGRLLELQQVYFIDHDTAYIVSGGATQDTFATYAPVFDQITGTFHLGVP